jgi:thiol-disulfide isomerase/thioredoxin
MSDFQQQQIKIITELSVKDLIDLQKTMGAKIVVIKFSAQWCKPCKMIKPTWDYWIQNNKQTNIIYCELDIDETMDLYIALKKFKMVNGIPALLMYQGNLRRDHWFVPDDSFVGGDVEGFKLFLNRCVLKAKSIS